MNPLIDSQIAYLNGVGRDLLERGKPADAIATLNLNAEQHPNSFDVYDALGLPSDRRQKSGSAELSAFAGGLPRRRQLQPQETGHCAGLNKQRMKVCVFSRIRRNGHRGNLECS